MPRAADTRILQMQFDNKDFERDVKTSEKSLERFKEALDFSKCEKGLDNLGKKAKSLSFDNLVNNIQKLTDKFTGLGTVSELVLSQIRRGIESTASKISGLVNSLAFDTVGEGKTKFEQLNKSVQAIIAATGRSETDVYRVMERLNKYTDQTSYSFSDMADNIGKFTAVGISLEDAEKQMEGIANWAARSGAGINEASRAMYNLSQAMGMGKMTKVDWKSIENARMATKEFKNELIQAGISAGTLIETVDKKTGKSTVKTAKKLGKQVEVNYQNLADTLSKGWATREVMESTLARYYYDDLYYEGENAIKVTKEQKEQIDKIFSDSDSKVDAKDWKTLNSIGLATDEVKQKAIDAAVAEGKLVAAGEKGGKKIYKTAKKYGKEISFTLDTIETSLETGWLDKRVAEQIGLIDGLAKASYEAAQKCTTLVDVFRAWKDQLSTGWMRAWQKIFGGLSESMELFSAICNKVGDDFSGFIRILTGDGEDAKGILGFWESAGGRDSLWSLFVGEYDGLYEGAYGFLDVIHDVGDMISKAFWDLLYTLNAGTLEAKGISQDEWFENEDYRTWFIGNRFKEALDNVRQFIQGIKDYFNAVPAGDTESRLDKIQKFINGVFSVGTLFWTSITDLFNFFTQLFDQDHLGKTVDSIIDILEALGISIRTAATDSQKGNGLKIFFDTLLEKLGPVIEAINTFSQKMSEIIVKFLKTGSEGGRFNKFWTNLVELFGKILDVVAKVAAPVFDFITDLIDIVNMLFTEGFDSKSIKKAGSMLSNALEKLFGGIFALFPKYGAKIEQFFAYIFGFAEDNAKEEADGSGSTIIGVIKKWLRTIFGGTKDFLKTAKNEFGNVSLFSIIKENLGIGLLGKFISGLAGIVKGTNLYGIFMSFLGAFTLIRLIKVLKQGGGLFDAIGGFFKGLKGKSVKDILFGKTEKQTQTLGEKLWTIAKAIGLIVAAVVILGNMPIERLVQGGIAFGIIIAAIAGLVLVMSKVKIDSQKLLGMVATLIGIGTAVLGITIGISLLILALKPLASMRMDQIASMLTGFIGILAVLALFLTAVKSIKVKGIGSLALLAIGIGILVKSLQPLANISVEGLLKMGISLWVILDLLTEFSKKVSFIKGSGMGSLVMVAASIWILLEALKPLAKYSWEGLGKMAAGLVVLMGVLLIFTKKSSYMKGSGMGSLVMVAISIWILLEALKPLATYSWENLGKMAAGLAVLMIVLTKFTKDSESMRFTGMAQLVIVAASIWLLVQALLPLANVSWPGLAKMGVGLLVLVAVIAVMNKISSEASLIKGAGLGVMLVALAVVIASFALMMGALNGVSWESIAAACLGLIAILVVFALIMKQMMLMKVKDIAKMLPIFLMLIGLSAVMIAFSAAMNEIKGVDAGKILAFSAGLSAVMLVFVAALKLVSGIPIVAAVKGILVISLGIAALLGVIALLAPLVIGSIGNALTEMSSQLALVSSIIGTFCGRMDNVDEGSVDKGENVLKRIKDIVASLAGFIGFRTDISGFTDVLFDLGTGLQNFSWHMNQAGDVSSNGAIKLIQDLAACADDLDIITKMNIDTLTSKITGLGGAMMLYAQGAKEIAGQGGIELDENNVPDVTAAVELMKAITSGLASEDGLVIPENMPDEEQLGLFGAQLAALAGAMIQFEQAGSGLGEGTEKALEVIDYFKKLKDRLDESAFIESYNFVTGTFDKENVDISSLETFAKNIEQLGAALGNFSSNTTTFNEETGKFEPLEFDAAIDTLTSFVDLKERMPKIGGVVQFFTGTNENLTSLGAEIESFGTSLADLTKTLVGEDENGNKKFDAESTAIVKGAVDDMVEILTVLYDNLPNLGSYGMRVSLVKDLFEDRPAKIDELGAQLARFGDALHFLSNSVIGNDEDGNPRYDPITMTVVKDALNGMIDIFEVCKEKLPTLGAYGTRVSFWNDLFKDRPATIDELGVQLSAFGKSLHELSDCVSGTDEEGNLKFDPSVLETAKSSLNTVTDLMRTLNTELPRVGGAGEILSTIISGRNMNLEDVSKQLGHLGSGLTTFGQALKDGHWNEELGTVSAMTAIDSLVDIMLKIGTAENMMYSAGTSIQTVVEFMKMFGTSFDDLQNESIAFFNLSGQDSLATLIVKMMADIDKAFDEYGDIDINKIKTFTSMAEAIGYLSNVNPKADWECIGTNITAGVASGIAKGTSDVINAAIDMAVSAYEAATKALDMNSPSKVFETIGGYSAEGMAIGIVKGTGNVENASEDMANSAISSVQEPLDLLKSLLTDDIDMNPVITPVLDLSNVTSGSQMINGLFNNPYGLNLNGGTVALDPTKATIYADTSLPRDYSEPINSIRNEVAELRGDLKNMSDAMRQMKFVFNSGAVVAAIGPDMDAYLGRQGYYAVRGEIP